MIGFLTAVIKRSKLSKKNDIINLGDESGFQIQI